MDKLIHIDLGNLGDLAKPATELIKQIFEAVGGEPRRIRRMAKAEADAEITKAKTKFEIANLSVLEQRSLNRLLSEESQKQLNMETIIAHALPYVSEQAKPQELENDWLTHFLDKARLISDKSVQEIWSRLIAEEVNTPGEFSKRSIDHLFSMSRKDAELFTKLCSFVIDLKRLVTIECGAVAKPEGGYPNIQGGDSGSPVITRNSSGAMLAGEIFGGNPANGGIWMNNMGGILRDLGSLTVRW